MATVCTSDVAHSGPSNAQGVCVYAQTHEQLGGTLVHTLCGVFKNCVLKAIHIDLN